MWLLTKQGVALLFCTPGYRHSPPHFHLCGSRSVCNQRKLPTRGGDAGCRCSRAHCAQDELSTDQDIMRGLTPPTTPALLAWMLCKYLEQTLLWVFITIVNKCRLKVFSPIQTGYRSWMMLYEFAVNVDIIENTVSVFFCFYQLICNQCCACLHLTPQCTDLLVFTYL